MSKRDFIDTNVFFYAFAETGAKSEIAEQLLTRGGTVSVQILNELASVLRRRFKMGWNRIQLIVDTAIETCPDPRPLSFSAHLSAMRLSERFGYSIYDGLILASALEAGCTTLYTEDLQHGQIVEGLRIVNPFPWT